MSSFFHEMRDFDINCAVRIKNVGESIKNPSYVLPKSNLAAYKMYCL